LDRLVFRRAEYIEIFALKRTREHFEDIFYSRFQTASIEDLSHCSQDIIAALDEFYSHIDDLKWYFNHTEDMPATVEEKVERELKSLEKSYEKLSLYIDAELGVIQETNDIGDIPSIPSDFDS
jgi:hypothetical protein